jgi:GntR family transcriptional regulator
MHMSNPFRLSSLSIQPALSAPIYQQIVEQVRRHVASGQLQAGGELPSVRALAAEHAINPMTVSKAYSLLEAEGLLERRRGLGMVVAADAGRAALGDRLIQLKPALDAAAQAAHELGISHEHALAAFAASLKAKEKLGG